MTDASIERQDGGWRVRIPLHREDVTLKKNVVVVEEVDIRRELVEEPVYERSTHSRRTTADVEPTQRL